MIEARDVFLNHLLDWLALGLLGLVAWFIKKEYSRSEEQMKSFSDKMTVWEASIKKHFADTRTHLAMHSDSMGKATKAINGDMLKIRENLFEVKQELFDKIEKTKTDSSELDQKIGRVIELKKDISMAHGKIIHLEENTGILKVDISEQKKNIRNLGQIIKLTRDDLENLKGKK